MKDILDPRHRSALARFVGEGNGPLLAFDYDGVLAPLSRNPAGARMRPGTKALLARLSRHYPVAAVSGRAWRDTARLVEGVVPTVVGNHGFELGHPVAVPASVKMRTERWRRRLEEALAGVPGVHVEDKRSTLTIHYGLSRTWRRAEKAVYQAANALRGTRLIRGKKMLNVLPQNFPTKGDAVRALLARVRLPSAVYAGDDVTDEDAFAVGAPLVFGIHVGEGPSLAPWCIPSQADLDELLGFLLSLRAERRTRPERAAAGRVRAGARGVVR